MARPALTPSLRHLVSVGALAAGCAAAAPSVGPALAVADLAPATSATGSVAVVGDERAAVRALVEAWRGALEARDEAGLRALIDPTVGGFARPGPGVSREGWLVESAAIFAAAARVRPTLATYSLVPYAECAPRCANPLLAPGEFIVAWPGVPVERAGLHAPSNQVLPSRLRVAVTDGVARVVGVDDEVAAARGPTLPRPNGSPRP